MRTTLLICLSSLALVACSSPPPDETTGTTASGTAGASGTAAAATGSSTGAAANGSTGTSGGTGTGGSSTGGTSTGAGVEAGTLWIGGQNALNPGALAKSATNPMYNYTCPPVATLMHQAQGGAEVIDNQGNLWTQFFTSQPTNTISMWAPSQLVASCGSRHPNITLGISQQIISNLAFDAAGNLWASAPSANEILGFGATSLLVSANVGPTYTLTQSSKSGIASLFNPDGLAFDSMGTLWIANYYSILAYHSSTLLQAQTSGGNPMIPPDLVLTNPMAANYEADGGLYNLYAYQYLAFDGSGNLWVTVQNSQTPGSVTAQIIEFSAMQLTKLATNNQPTPIFTINQPSDQPSTFSGWSAIAFDKQGNLWAGAHLAAPNLYRYPAATLTGSGTPDIIITAQDDTDMNLNFSLAFDPSTVPTP